MRVITVSFPFCAGLIPRPNSEKQTISDYKMKLMNKEVNPWHRSTFKRICTPEIAIMSHFSDLPRGNNGIICSIITYA